MAASSPTITLITGPNRGLGRGFLEAILARPHNLVVAAVRDPASKASQDLLALPKGDSSQVKLVKIDSAIETDAAKAVESLKRDGFEYIDRVIANAGIGDIYKPFLEVDLKDMRRHMDVNLFGVLALVQATTPLLRNSKDPNGPKMIFLGSAVGSFVKCREFPGLWTCYGVTKAAMHYVALQLHLEIEWLTSVVLAPGWVKTDISDILANTIGMQPPLSVKESVGECLKVIDEARRDKFSGDLVEYNGEVISY